MPQGNRDSPCLMVYYEICYEVRASVTGWQAFFYIECIWQSSLFLSHVLDLLLTLKRNGHRTRLTTEFCRDIAWWLRFLRTYSGVSIISSFIWTAPDTVFSTDACLLGCGSLSQSQYFHIQFPPEVLARFLEIHLLEALAILVALRLWGHLWAGCRIQVFCDNAAVLSALTSGKVKDQSLAALLCDIWYLAASHDFELRTVHLPGKENRAADLPARWHLDSNFGARFWQLPVCASLSSVSVPHDFFTVYDYYHIYPRIGGTFFKEKNVQNSGAAYTLVQEF